MTNNETQADIIAEMREYAARCRNENFGTAPECEAHYNEDDVDALADRLEAARKREREAAEARQLNECVVVREEEASEWRKRTGNAAAMREAILAIKSVNDGRPHDAAGYEINDIIEEALAEPPRNCDMFAKWHEAWDAFRAEYGGPTDPGETAYYFGVWLFAQAKGGKE